MQEKGNVPVRPSASEEIEELLASMSPEQIAALKERLRQRENMDQADKSAEEQGKVNE